MSEIHMGFSTSSLPLGWGDFCITQPFIPASVPRGRWVTSHPGQPPA